MILGVDPGSRTTGYGFILTKPNNQYQEVASGCIRVAHPASLTDKLHKIYSDLFDLIKQYQPEETAVEDVFIARSPLAALRLGHARAAALLAIANCGLTAAEYQPRKIKKAVAGTGKATKAQVQIMVRMFLKVARPLQEDAADALAVAICHAHYRGMAKYNYHLQPTKTSKNPWSTGVRRRRMS